MTEESIVRHWQPKEEPWIWQQLYETAKLYICQLKIIKFPTTFCHIFYFLYKNSLSDRRGMEKWGRLENKKWKPKKNFIFFSLSYFKHTEINLSVTKNCFEKVCLRSNSYKKIIRAEQQKSLKIFSDYSV